MRDYFEPMLGATGALIAQFAITLAIVLILVLIVFWLIRRFTGNRFGNATARGRQPRLSVLDALPIDANRRLLLIRRDNVEHLLLVGGAADIVVEAAIHRSSPAQRRLETMPGRQAPQTPNGRPASPVAPEPTRPPLAEFTRSEVARNPTPPPAPETTPELPAEDYSYRAEPVREEAEPIIQQPAYVPPVPVAAEPPAPPQRPVPRPAPTTRAPSEPSTAKTGRGLPSFLSGGRSRQTPTIPVEPPVDRNRILGRSRPTEPERQPAAAMSQGRDVGFSEPGALEPAPIVRANVPPAPPIPARMPGEAAFGAPETEIGRPLRFEPVIEAASEGAEALSETLVPSVEPPMPTDQPVDIEAAFDENAPILSHPDVTAESEAAARASAVGDLEKEMARLLGEISGGRKK